MKMVQPNNKPFTLFYKTILKTLLYSPLIRFIVNNISEVFILTMTLLNTLFNLTLST